VLAPGEEATLVVDLLYREVSHEAVGRGAVPVCSPGLKNTRSPARLTSIGPPRRWQRPTPWVT
jgi:hypothetical protein